MDGCEGLPAGRSEFGIPNSEFLISPPAGAVGICGARRCGGGGPPVGSGGFRWTTGGGTSAARPGRVRDVGETVVGALSRLGDGKITGPSELVTRRSSLVAPMNCVRRAVCQ